MLEGKTILVIGAGGLLGACVSKRIQSLGANVIAADISIEVMSQKLTDLGFNINKSILEKVDITNDESLQELFNKSGIIDGAVNCTYPRNKAYGAHFFDVKVKDFNDNLSLHLGSAFLFTQMCAKYFKCNQRPFSLVNVASIYGVVAPDFDIYDKTSMTMPVEYAAIKSSIIHITKYAVKYVRDSRFRVNSVSPGGLLDNQPQSFQSAYKQKTNGKGMLDVEDITGAIIFLLSDESKFITAQNMIVDDGFTI